MYSIIQCTNSALISPTWHLLPHKDWQQIHYRHQREKNTEIICALSCPHFYFLPWPFYHQRGHGEWSRTAQWARERLLIANRNFMWFRGMRVREKKTARASTIAIWLSFMWKSIGNAGTNRQRWHTDWQPKLQRTVFHYNSCGCMLN